MFHKIKDCSPSEKSVFQRSGNKIERCSLNTTLMHRYIAVLLLTGVVSCNSKDPQQNFSTVDSNVAGTPDSMPRRLHLDSFRKDTSVRVALDSMAPTITSRDTSYPTQR